MTTTMSSTSGGTGSTNVSGGLSLMREIRVPAKVVNVWRDDTGWYCALEDGRVYEGRFDVAGLTYKAEWTLYLPAIPDR